MALLVMDTTTNKIENYTTSRDVTGFVQLRTVMSRSPDTAATIDVNVPGIDITKVKFNP